MTESDLTNPAEMAKGITGKFWLLVEDVYPTLLAELCIPNVIWTWCGSLISGIYESNCLSV